MDALLQRVARTIQRHALLSAGDRLALAVSGGPDSVAMAWLACELAERRELGAAIAGMIHVNHGLRPGEADRDEAFCRALAARLGWPIEVGRFDVAARARAEGHSLEVAARRTRYEFFREAAGRLDATAVATGHTSDDQAETVLLRLLRGAGSRGVSGIRVRRPPFIRPLLECRRADLHDYLSSRGEPCCDDSSNRDLTIARNRVRHELLPAIARLAPGGVRALARFAALSADDDACLEAAAIERAAGIVVSVDGAAVLDRAALLALPVAVARRVVRLVLEQAHPNIALAAAHVEAVLELAAGTGPGRHLDLPGLAVRRVGTALHVGGGTPGALPFERPLGLPGLVRLPEAGLSIEATRADRVPERFGRFERSVAVLSAAAIVAPFVVRSRRSGDRLRPLGAPGRRKLQDLLVDRKVPKEARDRVPIVTDATGRIVWVAEVAIAEECRVREPAAGVVVLELRRDGRAGGAG